MIKPHLMCLFIWFAVEFCIWYYWLNQCHLMPCAYLNIFWYAQMYYIGYLDYMHVKHIQVKLVISLVGCFLCVISAYAYILMGRCQQRKGTTYSLVQCWWKKNYNSTGDKEKTTRRIITSSFSTWCSKHSFNINP